jgi:hypothetical protein
MRETQMDKNTLVEEMLGCYDLDYVGLCIIQKSVVFKRSKCITYASTVAFSDLIYLVPIPKKYYKSLEANIEEILEHETLHVVMYKLGMVKESESLDKICPFLGDWEKITQ